jgi:hypothetical protein
MEMAQDTGDVPARVCLCYGQSRQSFGAKPSSPFLLSVVRRDVGQGSANRTRGKNGARA